MEVYAVMEIEAVKNTAVQPSAEKKAAERKPEPVSSRAASIEKVKPGLESAGAETQAEKSGEDKEKMATERQILKAIEHVKSSKNNQTRCEFSYHDEINRVSIKVINKETDEVIREIPPEKSLEMVEKMWELAGILIDQKM